MTSVTKKQEALLDELLKDYTDLQDILSQHGLLKHLTKRVVERALEAELTAHLGYAPHARQGGESDNYRNGKGKKTVHMETGRVDIEVPRDRHGSFEPHSCTSVSGAWTASIPKCWRCMPVGCPRATFRP